MVFPSFPLYLDPPNNWNQQQVQLPGGGGGASEAPQLAPPPLVLVPPRANAGISGSATRPGSMAGRARLPKLEQAALKCPRCDSTNTKFCYFNNYSLSQPRHFCKTCRRYWTHGGALRNVPVGGGCRRSNKRTKPTAGGGSSSSAGRQSGQASSSSAVVLQQPPPPPDRLPDSGAPGTMSFAAAMETLDHPVGLENLRFESPMSLTGLEPPPLPPPPRHLPPVPSLLYSSFIVGDGSDLDGRFGGQLESDSKAPSSGFLMQQQLAASVKMEDDARGRLSQYYGWGAGSSSGGWATTAGFSSFN